MMFIDTITQYKVCLTYCVSNHVFIGKANLHLTKPYNAAKDALKRLSSTNYPAESHFKNCFNEVGNVYHVTSSSQSRQCSLDLSGHMT